MLKSRIYDAPEDKEMIDWFYFAAKEGANSPMGFIFSPGANPIFLAGLFQAQDGPSMCPAGDNLLTQRGVFYKFLQNFFLHIKDFSCGYPAKVL